MTRVRLRRRSSEQQPGVQAQTTAQQTTAQSIQPIAQQTTAQLAPRTRPLVLPKVEDLVAPNGKPNVIFVIGGAGPHGFWQAGVYAGLKESLNPVYYSVASAGTFTGLALAAELSVDEIYRLIVERFDDRLVQRAQWGGLAERFNLDLGGFLTMRGIREAVGELLDSAQIKGFEDLSYKPGESRPNDAWCKVGISVTAWKSKWNPGRLYSPEELQDSVRARRIFRKHLWRKGNGPLLNTVHVELPHEMGLFPAFLHDAELHELAIVAEISCSQMFVTLPKIVQDPKTLEVWFVTDGAHVLNLPSRYGRGPFHPEFPLLAARLEPIGGYGRHDSKRIKSGMVLPYGHLAVAENTFPRLTVRDVMHPDRITPELREQLFEEGYQWGRDYGVAIAPRLPEWYRGRITDVQERARLDRMRHGLEVDSLLEYGVASASPLWHQTAPLGRRSEVVEEVSPLGRVKGFGDEANPHYGYSTWGGNC